MPHAARLALVLLLALAAGFAPAAAQEADLPPDPHSYARPAEARVTHLELDLEADFEARRLEGTATLSIEAAPGASEIVLDVRDLDVRRAEDEAGQPLAFELGEEDPILGRPLAIALPEGGGRIRLHYRTSPEAAAVLWLGPAQTASGRPFLFTQGQAILTRTWIPTQDSPGIRQTYEARITVPEGLTAVMGAEMLSPSGEPAGDGRAAFRFRMQEPIPPYLIALAVGDLAFREIGPRTGTWAEPPLLEAAAEEFADLEAMIDAAEALYGPYRWGRYDVLVLPPAFPFGGMENPRLTFVTPTILAGDRSLVTLVAHELAHSWSGNLVTNATWDDFWLNEGFTRYIENRIMEVVYGPDYAKMIDALDRVDLMADLEALPPADTHLRLDLAGRDPDEGMTAVAYEKGAAFLRTLEHAAGRERLDAFLRAYFDAHAFQPMTSERFLEYLERELFADDEALRAAVDPEAWVYGPGLPENAAPAESETFARVEAQAEAFAAGAPPEDLETAAWTTHEWRHFLGSLPRAMGPEHMEALDAAFGLSETGNSEILFAWLRLAIRSRYEPAFPALERFLTTQGRRKFILPLYTELAEQGAWGRALAGRIYREARPGYHAITAQSVDAVLGEDG